MSLRLQTMPSTSFELSNGTSCILPTEVVFCKNDCRTAEEPLTVPDLDRLAEGWVLDAMSFHLRPTCSFRLVHFDLHDNHILLLEKWNLVR